MSKGSPEKPAPGMRKFPASLVGAEGFYMEAWNLFCELDADGSGSLDKAELAMLMKRVNHVSDPRKIAEAFDTMDPMGSGSVNFVTFAGWWNTGKEMSRLKLKRAVRDTFEAIDADGDARLNRAEFALFARRAKAHLKGLEPPFDLAADWGRCAKVVNAHTGEEELTYQKFEMWWKERLGIVDANIPVLPEFMVQKIEEAHYFDLKRNGGGGNNISGEQRTGKELWDSLRPRLLSVVRQQRHASQGTRLRARVPSLETHRVMESIGRA